MKNHVDNIYRSHGQQYGYPHLTSLLFLNDNYEGGEFVMLDDTYKAKVKQGSVIVFPSNFMYDHEVKKVTKGNRYSVMTWIM
jgi:predicted 2-oxoglutarate/Fe(II)-dependent dioxygenase YbiX